MGKRNKVLVIDDDENMLFLLESILSDAKYKVITAKSGKEGIEQAKKAGPDIIILDIMMPELDGLATILKMKSKEETRSIPIIMCTAVKEGEDEIVARNLGVADFCRKSAQMEGLLEKIERVLNR